MNSMMASATPVPEAEISPTPTATATTRGDHQEIEDGRALAQQAEALPVHHAVRHHDQDARQGRDRAQAIRPPSAR